MGSTLRLSPSQLQLAVELLKAGSLVAFPTETVYGLGASIFLPAAIEMIYKAKGRPADNPLIAHVSSLEQVKEIAIDIPPVFYRLVETFWPGPLTLVLKRHPDVPAIVSAGLNTIAVRMPSHPIARELISLAGTPLVAPSANLSGRPSSTCFEHVLEDFEGKIAAVVQGGKTEIGIESTVLSLIGDEPVLLRPGSISQKSLEDILGSPIAAPAQHSGPVLSPGMKYRHYCPKTPIKLFHTLDAVIAYFRAAPHKRCMYLAKQPLPEYFPLLQHFPLSAPDFYALLRLADRDGYDEIVILGDEEVQSDSGLMNRILRASGQNLIGF